MSNNTTSLSHLHDALGCFSTVSIESGHSTLNATTIIYIFRELLLNQI